MKFQISKKKRINKKMKILQNVIGPHHNKKNFSNAHNHHKNNNNKKNRKKQKINNQILLICPFKKGINFSSGKPSKTDGGMVTFFPLLNLLAFFHPIMLKQEFNLLHQRKIKNQKKKKKTTKYLIQKSIWIHRTGFQMN